jgi:fatty acid desaturase
MQVTSPASDRQETSLLRAIAARARRTSDAALVACAVAGLVAIGGLVWMQGRGWGILLPTVALGLWGAWGIVDRTLRERAMLRDEGTHHAPPPVSDGALRATRLALALAGVATGIAGALALLAMLLGRIIS